MEQQTIETTQAKEVLAEKTKKKRNISIDRFRGLCILLVVLQFLVGVFEDAFAGLAPIVEHDLNGFQILPGVSFADLFAPMFIFVIGMTIVRSFKSREEKYGTKKAYFQLATRFLALIGIGASLNGFEDGWLEIFQGTKWTELGINDRVFAIAFWINVALVLLVIVSRLFKKVKFRKVAANILRYALAITGIACLYFIMVRMGEITTSPDPRRFGGNVWDTLQNIGLAGLLALPFVKFDKWGRLAIVAVVYTAMTIFVQNGGYNLAHTILEGGVLGGFGWSGILLLGSVFIELKTSEKDKNKYWILTSLLILISVVLIVSFNFAAAKRGCTPVYAMFCTGVGAMLFGLIDAFRGWTPKFDFLTWWGGSSILVYVVNYLLCLILGIIFEVAKYSAPIWLAIIIVVLCVTLFSVMNWYLNKKNKHIRI